VTRAELGFRVASSLHCVVTVLVAGGFGIFKGCPRLYFHDALGRRLERLLMVQVKLKLALS